MELFRLLLLCVLIVPLVYAYKSYEGYQVLRTAELTKENVRMLLKVQEHSDVDFWLEPRVGGHADIMVSPQYLSAFKSVLNSFGIETSILIENVETVVQKEREQLEEKRRTKKIEGRAPSFDTFLTWEEIQAYLDTVVATYSWTSYIDIGFSYEGLPLRVLKISNGGTGKPAIYLEGAAHAREWIGPPTLLYAINELTENLAINNNSGLLDIADLYILVITNPDGYRFTHSDDRFWRKTRNPNVGSACMGTDPNRNYDHAFVGGGSSPLPCSDTYRGETPFSCPETQAVSQFLTNHTEITCFVDVHSYGKWLLTPWGDVPTLPPTYAQLQSVGTTALAALEAIRGTQYVFGSTYNTLYQANGVGEDWAYGVLGIPLAYVIELPEGGSGFDPPPTDILPVATETWEFYKSLIRSLPAPAARH